MYPLRADWWHIPRSTQIRELEWPHAGCSGLSVVDCMHTYYVVCTRAFFRISYIHTEYVHTEPVKRLSAGKSPTATYVFPRKPPFPSLTGKGKQTQKLASAGLRILIPQPRRLALKKGGKVKAPEKKFSGLTFAMRIWIPSRKSGRKTYSVHMQIRYIKSLVRKSRLICIEFTSHGPWASLTQTWSSVFRIHRVQQPFLLYRGHRLCNKISNRGLSCKNVK